MHICVSVNFSFNYENMLKLTPRFTKCVEICALAPTLRNIVMYQTERVDISRKTL